SSIRAPIKTDEYSPLDEDGITALRLSYSGEHLFVAGTGGRAAMFDITTKHTQCLYDCSDYDSSKGRDKNFTGVITALVLSYCNNYVFTGCDSGKVICWNDDSSVPLIAYSRQYGGLSSMALTRSGQHLFSAGTNKDNYGIIRLWRTDTDNYMGHFDVADCGVMAIALSYNEKTVIAALEDGSLVFFDSVTGKERDRVEHNGIINAIALSPAISPDNSMFLTACQDGSIGLWNYNTRRLQARYDAHEEGATCVAFSPDGQYFASGGKDATVSLWSIHNQECLQKLQGHGDAVSAVVFSPDGWLLYSAGMDSKVIRWFLNWTLDQQQDIHCKTQANGIVSEFLSYQYRRGNVEKNKPSWSEDDLDILRSRIMAAGFEYASEELLKDKLPSYQDKWTESVPKFHTLEMDEPKSKDEISQQEHARTDRTKILRLTVAVLIVLVVVGLAAYIYTSRKDRYNELALSRFALFITNDDRAHEALDYVKGKSPGNCDIKDLNVYKDSYFYMVKTHLTAIMSTPPRTQQNVSCLVVLSAGKDVQDALISQFLGGNNAETLTALSYLLSYAGNDVLSPLLVALTDPPKAWEFSQDAVDKGARQRLVAQTIVYMGSTEAVNAIIEYALRDDIDTEPIAPYIRKIIASKRLDVDAALKTIERLMGNKSDEVRKNAVAALEFFKGSEAKRLAQKALTDNSSIRAPIKTDEYSPLDEDGITALRLSYSGEHLFVAGTGGRAA
ncbi:MAG: WD40 repeat domain-containing protein, partial [Nitrospirae bacterium]|nr:WD40 repeat domain-containing protein [Nitrospirota bacterium]